MTSLSGMKEKFRIIFEAATAHCCFSARPSSSRLNKPSSSNHQSEERDLDIFFCTTASVTEEPDPRLPYEYYPIIRSQLVKVNLMLNIWITGIKYIYICWAYPGYRRVPFEPNTSYSFPNPVTREFAPSVLTLGVLMGSFESAISRQSSICLNLECSE